MVALGGNIPAIVFVAIKAWWIFAIGLFIYILKKYHFNKFIHNYKIKVPGAKRGTGATEGGERVNSQKIRKYSVKTYQEFTKKTWTRKE